MQKQLSKSLNRLSAHFDHRAVESKWPFGLLRPSALRLRSSTPRSQTRGARRGKQDYNPGVIEPKWQKVWEKEGLYQPDIKRSKNPFYNLMMFPYPSALGLHVGNIYAFVGSDIYGRLKRMQGFDVF